MMRLRVDGMDRTTHTDCAHGLYSSRPTAASQDAPLVPRVP